MSSLNESQRAMVAARLATLERGRPGESRKSAEFPPVTQEKAAAMLNVGERTVDAYVAALAFREEFFVHYAALADELVQDAAVLEGVEQAHQHQKRVAGACWAAALGLPQSLAAVAEVLLYSHSRSARAAAADLLVRAALREFPKLSSRALAKLCGVSDPFVNGLRPQLQTVSSSARRTSLDGKQRPAGRRVVPERQEEPESAPA